MSRIGSRFNSWFMVLGHFIFGYRWIVLFLCLIITGLFATQLSEIEIDLSTESYLHQNDPILLGYNEFKKQFGRDEFIIVAIEPFEIFSQDFLSRLKLFHEDLEKEVPHLEEIKSLINARNTHGDRDRFIVEDLLRNWPKDEAAMKTLKKRVQSNPLFINSLISEDGRVTAILIKTDIYSESPHKEQSLEDDGGIKSNLEAGSLKELIHGFNDKDQLSIEEPQFLTDADNQATVKAIRKVIARYQAWDFNIYLTGSPIITDLIKRSLLRDAKAFVGLVLFTITICLFIMFRRVSGIFNPLIIVGVTLVSTLGIMSILDIPLTLPTNILPSFILAVGIADSVHILAIFYREYEKVGDREESIARALGQSGLAIVLTSLTTATGLASFAMAEIAPIAELGTISSIGVLLALLYSIFLLPSLLSIVPVRRKQAKGLKVYRTDRILARIADFTTEHYRAITMIAFLIIIFSITGLLRLSFSHNPMAWFSKGMSIRNDTEKVDQALKGTVVLEVLIDTGRENGLYDLDILNKLDSLTREMETFREGDIFIGKATSLVDILKEIHQALNENRPEYYKVPQDPALIPQLFLLFENTGSDDLGELVDSHFSKARFTIKVPWGDAIEYMPYIEIIENKFKHVFEKKAIITSTGMMPLLVRIINAAMKSAAKSYVIAFVVISLMMVLLIGGLRIGLLCMIPNLLPIVLSLSVMGWLDLPLDMFTMLIGNIAIGISVDDTIHFIHNFEHYYNRTGNINESVHQTFFTVGRAIVITTVVLSLGFFVYMFASMRNLFHFGLITGITIIVALLSDLFLAPALMVLSHRQRNN